MKYRAEIDGLRALAVLPVVFYHAGFNFLSGGFIGVDIFFVISGYLITTLILEEASAGNFSITRFYERRARRILPALFSVVALCFPFAWYLLPASDLFEFCQSVQALVLFLSNYLFMDKSGYFDAAAELKPLLHTWSLAVEEQYYALFPLLLVTSYRYLKINGLKVILIFFVFASLFASYIAIKLAPTFNFFSLPTRSWELLVGALAAISLIQNKRETDRAVAQSASLIGVLGIVISITCFDKSIPIPSFYVLLPTLCTALIIRYATAKTIVGEILSTPPFVSVGLLSYSFYLIHQPIFVFARHASMEELSPRLMIVLIGLTFVFAYVSWRFIEQPFRQKEFLSRRKIFIYWAMVSFAFLVIASIATSNEGFPERFHIPENLSQEFKRDSTALGCSTISSNYEYIKACEYGEKPSSHQIKIAVLGDSHSEKINKLLDKLGRENGFSYVHIGLGGCPPLIGVDVVKGNWRSGVCSELAEKQFTYVRDHGIKKILLVARWALYTENDDHEKMVSYFLVSDKHKNISQENSRLVFYDQLKSTIQMYRSVGVEIFVLLQPPQQLIEPIRFYQKLYKSDTFSFNEAYEFIHKVSVTYPQHLSLQRFNRVTFDRQSKEEVVNILNPDPYFCNQTVCDFGTVDRTYYSDTNHLSTDGLQKIRSLVEGVFVYENPNK